MLVAACSGGDDVSPRVTLTAGECTYEGDETPSSWETFEAEARNQSSAGGTFGVWRLDEGRTFADAEAEARRLKNERPRPGLFDVIRTVTAVDVPPGESGNLAAVVSPGTYVAWCAVHGELRWSDFLLATPPIEVVGTPPEN